MENNTDWKNVIITCVGIICATIAFGLFVSGCNGCAKMEHDYRLKALERR